MISIPQKHKHEHEHQQDSQDEQQHQQHAIKQIHGLVLTISWFALLQIGIWSHYFRHYRYSILIHILCMSLITILSIIGVVMMITAEGKSVIWQSLYHQTIGFVIVAGLLPITLVKGGIARLLMVSYGVETPWVVMMKQGHRIFGWVVVVLVQVPMMTGWVQDGVGIAVFIGLVDIGSYCLYWYLKLNKRKLQEILLNQNHTKLFPNSPTIESLTQYNRSFSGTCFIFANYIYKIQPVINVHPGGQLVIDHMRGRQVDRFLYGMKMLEKYDEGKVQPFSHSAGCLELAEQPVGRICILEPFLKLDQVSKCVVSYMETNENQSMYIVYLKLQQPHQYTTGYTHMNQLGRYRALCIQNTTRLYSNVEFLRPSNIHRMKLIMQTSQHQKYSKLSLATTNLINNTKQIELQQKLMYSNQDKDQYIPVYVKKYGVGSFSANLKENLGKNVVLSQSRGFGLGFENLEKSFEGVLRVVLIAGGTGLNPYCDLIDLLYKQMIIGQKLQGWQILLANNPILECGIAKNYKIILYIAIDSLSYIHPITLYQCEQLSKHGIIQCHLKLKHRTSMIEIQHIQTLPITYRFESIIEKQHELHNNTIFRVCGPNAMSCPILKKIQNLGIHHDRYRVL